ASAELAGEGGSQFTRHAAVERAADCKPPAVGLAVAGMKCLFGLLAGATGSGKAVLGEMTQRGVKHGIAGTVGGVVVRRPGAGTTDLLQTRSRRRSARRWHEVYGHGHCPAGGVPRITAVA